MCFQLLLLGTMPLPPPPPPHHMPSPSPARLCLWVNEFQKHGLIIITYQCPHTPLPTSCEYSRPGGAHRVLHHSSRKWMFEGSIPMETVSVNEGELGPCRPKWDENLGGWKKEETLFQARRKGWETSEGIVLWPSVMCLSLYETMVRPLRGGTGCPFSLDTCCRARCLQHGGHPREGSGHCQDPRSAPRTSLNWQKHDSNWLKRKTFKRGVFYWLIKLESLRVHWL